MLRDKEVSGIRSDEASLRSLPRFQKHNLSSCKQFLAPLQRGRSDMHENFAIESRGICSNLIMQLIARCEWSEWVRKRERRPNNMNLNLNSLHAHFARSQASAGFANELVFFPSLYPRKKKVPRHERSKNLIPTRFFDVSRVDLKKHFDYSRHSEEKRREWVSERSKLHKIKIRMSMSKLFKFPSHK